MLDGKQCGGNEFITAHILKRTGTMRTRKQISSHIQVLKAKLSDNEACPYSLLNSLPQIANLVRDEPYDCQWPQH